MAITPLPSPLPVVFSCDRLPQDNPESVQEALNALADSLATSFDPSIDFTDVILGQLNGVLPNSDVGPWANGSEWWFWNDNTGAYQRSDDSIAVGTIMAWGGTGTPANGNWLLCDGSEVVRTEYSALFKKIGTTWGAGDGRSTFNVPPGAKMFLNSPGFIIDPTVPLDPGFPLRFGVGARGGTQLSPILTAANLPVMKAQIFWFNSNLQQPGPYDIAVLEPDGSGGQRFTYQLTDINGAPLNNTEQTMFSIMPPFAAANYIIKFQ